MSVEIKKLQPVPLSELPDIGKPQDFWVFASKDNGDGTLSSGKFSLSDFLALAKDSLQLERRITMTIEQSSVDMYFDEELTIYKVTGVNIRSLNMVVGNSQTPVSLDQALNLKIPAKSIVTFNIDKSSMDVKTFLFIYARAKV